MRKPIPKSVRKLVYAKYDGHCAYCGSCNRYKATMDLEEFRKQLQKIPDRLARDVCTYNIAVRYGMVQENREPIKFYFEKMEETVNEERKA